MTFKRFLDTNILVYCADHDEPKKRKISRKLLKDIAAKQTGVISTQVLQEFFVVATKKLGLDPLSAKSLIHSFENLEVVTITPALVKEAVDCSILQQITLWDALIVVAAESAKCREVLTEDLYNGQTIRGVKIVNPY